MVGIGAITGVVGALFSEGFKAFKMSSDRKHEIKLLRMQQAIGAQETERAVAVASVNAQAQDLISSREHDQSFTGTSLWVANLRASVRPIVTYMVIVLAFVLYFNCPDTLTETQKHIVASFLGLMEATSMFWFTSRAIGKGR
jgi:hypothetical protein